MTRRNFVKSAGALAAMGSLPLESFGFSMPPALKTIRVSRTDSNFEREKLVPEASFIEDLGADSLDIVELVMEFEKEFGIDIPDEDAEKLRTVGDAVAYLEAKVAG